MILGLDFETYGSVNLPKHGLDRYVSDKFFQPLIACSYYMVGSHSHQRVYDFVNDMDGASSTLEQDLRSATVIAHNAGFEDAVLQWLGIEPLLLIDSAAVSRLAGGGSRLEAAAPQLLDVDKMEQGRDLIKLFSIPGEYQEENEHLAFDPRVVQDNPVAWKSFIDYCKLDAELSHRLFKSYRHLLTEDELKFQRITLEMNQRGWPVDVESVQEMQRRYLENLEQAEHDFRKQHGVELNFNSHKQLKEFCAARGVKAKSFDEKHVASMIAKLQEKLINQVYITSAQMDQIDKYREVLAMLNTKQILGGSSLKKLQVILDTVGEDGRLRDQYLHCGAGQSLRTTGRSVQMQNLKRLSSGKIDMSSLTDEDVNVDNEVLAQNVRQVFTSSDPNGALIVGDFKSVESRGLAWLAGEDWKLNAYLDGQDLYQVLADTFGNTRTFGKVSELSCGYGAGAGAVQEFALNMGIKLSEGEAQKLVYDWRDSCPRTVEFWSVLDEMLQTVMISGRSSTHRLYDAFSLDIQYSITPHSLMLQHEKNGGRADVPSIDVTVSRKNKVFLRRRFLGCHLRGRNIGYYKPSDRKTGDLWRNSYIDPKTKKPRFYEIYGGKLAGILTQSFCRELFFQSMLKVHNWCESLDHVDLIGQFHDEIILDWRQPSEPGALSISECEFKLQELMSDPGDAASFPLDAEVKHDYRYTK